jgi:hypothetical protein
MEFEVITLNPLVKVKAKLLDDIELQKQAADAQLRGQMFNPKGEDARSFHKWFFQIGGVWYSCLKVGNTSVHIQGGNCFKAGATLTDLMDWYDEVKEEIRSGGRDTEIQEAVKGRKKKDKPKVRLTAVS